MSWCSGFEQICRPDVPLAPLTWYRLGGPARWLVEPESEQQVAEVLRRLAESGIAWRVLGQGANILVRDVGFDGAVIRLNRLTQVRFQDRSVHAAAGADFPRLIRDTLARGLVGLEGLAGIPGTIGGIVRMNAGGQYGEIASHVKSVRCVTAAGETIEHDAPACGFGYRRSTLGEGVVVHATLELQSGDTEAARARHREIWTAKYATQPALAMRTSGCVFKNPPQNHAGRLLDQAGLKGTRVGGAVISEKHANFIVAGPDATATDVLALVELARTRVREQIGIELETEVEIW